MKKTLALLFSIAIAGCGLSPERMKVNDPRLKSMWQAAEEFDREKYGFSPLPITGDVRLESHSGGAYDAMIHIYGKTARTVAFSKTASGYRWIHEQESFKGPNKYTSVDGTFYEQIVLTFEAKRIASLGANKLSISYWGEDPRLANRENLELKDVSPILLEWGYPSNKITDQQVGHQ